MDPLEFLRVARNLSGSTQEPEWRTTIGRSYYAVFNHVRLQLEPIKPFPPMDPENHQRAVHYLTKANNPQLQSVGQTLKDLRTSRNNADYDMNAIIGQTDGQLALRWADRALEKLRALNAGAFKAAIAAIPTYHSKREA